MREAGDHEDPTTEASQAVASDASRDVSTDVPARSRPPRRVVFTGVAVVLYTVDQVTKAWAESALDGRGDVRFVGELLQLHLAYNPGAAFSLGTSYTVILSCVAIVAAVAILWFSRRLGSTAWAVALGFLMAGVCGNLTDRLLRDPGPLRGHVVDFLMLPNWPIFNVADICINIAAGLILIQAFRGIRLDGTRTTEQPSDEDDA